MAARPVGARLLLRVLIGFPLLIVAVGAAGVLTATPSAPGILGSRHPALPLVAQAGAAATEPSPAGGSEVATATVASLPLSSSPGAAPGSSLANPDGDGAALTLLVAQVQGDWVQVYVPQRPNGAEAWVPAGDVTFRSDPYRITVSLTSRTLTVFDGTAQMLQVPAAVGSPDSPTPIGSFFVTDVLQLTDPQDAYGPYALGLSAFSNTYTSFDGGPGQVAIHGTNQPWVIGGYASHGCVRLANADITQVAGLVRAGTPVVIGL